MRPSSSSSSQQQRRHSGTGPSHADMQPINSIDEPAPTLVNRHSRSHSVWSAHVPPPAQAPTPAPTQTPTQATAHAHAQHPHTHPHPSGIVTRLEEGLHEFTDKFEHDLTELTETGPLTRSKRKMMWDRFRGVGRRKVGWGESCRNVIRSSVLNILLLFIPFAWASAKHWKLDNLTFAFCFISIIPLEKLFDFGGEQMALYTGKDLGDLIMVTLNNAVEATLAIILLLKCELRILQATIVGVVLLHLLLVPGTGFLTGGARIYEQTLHPHYTQLNHTLLAVGCLSLIIPVAFFSALDTGTAVAESTLTSVADRVEFLQMSRGIAILLLLVYVASRIFLHNPPGEGNAFTSTPGAPEALRKQEEDLSHEDAKLNPWFCVLFLIVTIAVMAVTAELLVESIEHVRENGNITEEWFGLILLPLVSFSADGAVAVIYFLRAACFMKAEPPKTLAEDRAIDLSIQFTLFWMPFLVLIAWWTGRPLMLLFDLYEIAVLLAACFLVNYVTADSKTNWAEGYIMITFYILIALCTWFYPGQAAINALTSVCRARSLGGDALGEAAAVVEEVAGEVVQDLRRRVVFGG